MNLLWPPQAKFWAYSTEAWEGRDIAEDSIMDMATLSAEQYLLDNELTPVA